MFITITTGHIVKSGVAKKTIVLACTLLLTASFAFSQAPNTWTQIATYEGSIRHGSVSFGIGGKGYMGTGHDGISFKKDFWEYDPITNSWTQKADFGGDARFHAVGFSIGNKGYLGTGYSGTGTLYKDFWEYDPTANVWIQKTDFGGTARWAAAGLTIGNRGYLGTGRDGPGESNRNDFWEYYPTADSWIEKANYGGGNRYLVTGFSIGNSGYFGTGWDGIGYRKDFWEYNPDADVWTQKEDFGGSAREGAAGFNIGGKGYIGTGSHGAFSVEQDLWEYDPGANTWIQKSDFGGNGRTFATAFSVDGKAYLGTGYDYLTNYKDFWEYTPEISPCQIPTESQVTNITGTSAKLNWVIVPGAIGYKVRYKIAGTPDWTTLHSIDNDKNLHELSPNAEYAWQVKSICGVLPVVSSDWSTKQYFTTGDFTLSESIVHETTSSEVYPNPISEAATVSFFSTEASPVVIELIDVNGRSLKVIADENFSEGKHEVTFNRESLSAGIYFLQMKTDEGVMMKKLIVQ
jgi:hypothetical protein